ncbi:cytochrome P460 family protein [Malonomonas rubra]|uniref:cytochrome P460 family protein n=1 Tax=Malonomonas rubra TaxID=57040 RepID=UPI0026F03DF3|nr:cytochrome P460 family protein [Malonomonas rubra]
MKKWLAFFFLIAFQLGTVNASETVPSSPNGIDFPSDYKNWELVSSSHRIDNNTLRVITGNDIAIKSARSKQTNPWPDGTILAKIVWKQVTLPSWEKAIVPGEFVQVEFMVKDSKKYTQTGGWGFARWKGEGLQPYGEDASFVFECFGCHTPVKDNDYIFTHPSILP